MSGSLESLVRYTKASAGGAANDHDAIAHVRPVDVFAVKKEIERLRKIVWGVVHNLRHADDTTPRDEPGPLCGATWGKVAHVCGLGSTSAIALCREFDVDPDYDCTRAST